MSNDLARDLAGALLGAPGALDPELVRWLLALDEVQLARLEEMTDEQFAHTIMTARDCRPKFSLLGWRLVVFPPIQVPEGGTR